MMGSPLERPPPEAVVGGKGLKEGGRVDESGALHARSSGCGIDGLAGHMGAVVEGQQLATPYVRHTRSIPTTHYYLVTGVGAWLG